MLFWSNLQTFEFKACHLFLFKRTRKYCNAYFLGTFSFPFDLFTNEETRCGGYAPCGSASVITLLQKYRFPLSTRPLKLTHAQSTHTHNKRPSSVVFSPPSFTNTHCSSLHSFVPFLLVFFLHLVAPFSHPVNWRVATRDNEERQQH